MKRLILFELIIIFLATTFESDSPPGWFQQVLPRTDVNVQDIFFIDSLKGWTVARNSVGDTSQIYITINGGTNWTTQIEEKSYLTSIQFVNLSTGYCVGGIVSPARGIVKKTTNGGLKWSTISMLLAVPLLDVKFVNKDTGWVASDDIFDGGVFKTTDGGFNWQNQLNQSFEPTRLFFLNRDTGWVACNDTKLYRTTNSGVNWDLQFTFPQQINDIYFFNMNKGTVSSGRFYNTTDGGFNWIMSTSTVTGMKMSFVNDSIGWAGLNFIYVVKTINGGNTWFYQITNASVPSVSAIDNLNAWAGGSKLMHTTDGGGPPIGILYAGTEVSNYKLDQNFPNPFNPTTIIFFKLQEKSTVELLVYNILGEEVAEMVDDDHFTAGVYQFGFDASKYDLPSGVYFYRLTAKSEVSNNIFIDTKKMVLIK